MSIKHNITSTALKTGEQADDLIPLPKAYHLDFDKPVEMKLGRLKNVIEKQGFIAKSSKFQRNGFEAKDKLTFDFFFKASRAETPTYLLSARSSNLLPLESTVKARQRLQAVIKSKQDYYENTKSKNCLDRPDWKENVARGVENEVRCSFVMKELVLNDSNISADLDESFCVLDETFDIERITTGPSSDGDCKLQNCTTDDFVAVDFKISNKDGSCINMPARSNTYKVPARRLYLVAIPNKTGTITDFWLVPRAYIEKEAAVIDKGTSTYYSLGTYEEDIYSSSESESESACEPRLTAELGLD